MKFLSMTPELFGELLTTYPGLDRDEFEGAVIGQHIDTREDETGVTTTFLPIFTVELDNGEEFTITITKTREAS